jgi:16S rRNA G966 N2-methylase RsmD
MAGPTGAAARRHDRAYLLGAKRNDVLSLEEVRRYGADSFGDPDYVSLYGMRPDEWYARGVRLLGRTAVECTRDALADRIARDVAAAAGPCPPGAGTVVLDPFAGSANTLLSLARRLEASRAIGFERDPRVFAATARNLALIGVGADLREVAHEEGLRDVRVAAGERLVVFLAPPWGDALHPVHGLDLRRTAPPVTAIADLLARTFPDRELVVAIQVHETATADSLAAVRARFPSSHLAIYDLDEPGRNHGVLIGRGTPRA